MVLYILSFVSLLKFVGEVLLCRKRQQWRNKVILMVATMKMMEKDEGERFLAEHGSIMSEEAEDHLPRKTSSL